MKFSKQDAFVTVLILICIILLFFTYKHVERLAQGKGTPVGTVYFYEKVATRKVGNQLTWNQLEDAMPIYNYDILRTGTNSRAVVVFDDDSKIDLSQNTMLKINYSKENKNLNISAGTINFNGSGKKDGGEQSISLGKMTVFIPESSEVNITESKNSIGLEVLKGDIKIQSEDGQVQTIAEHSQLALSKTDNTINITRPSYTPLLPASKDAFLTEENKKIPINFVWESNTTVDEPRNITIQLSSYRNFSTIAVSHEVNLPKNKKGTRFKVALEVPQGSWFWRVVGQDGTPSAVRLFTILAADKIELDQPQQNAEILYQQTVPPVLFAWTNAKNIQQYTLHVATDRQFTNIVKTISSDLSQISITGLKAGTYFWRVTPIFKDVEGGDSFTSQVSQFTIAQTNVMESPRPLFPVDNAVIEYKDKNTASITLSCKPEPEGSDYVWNIFAEDGQNTSLVLQSKTPFISVAVKDIIEKIENGIFKWQVAWQKADGTLSPFSPLLKVSLKESVGKKEIKEIESVTLLENAPIALQEIKNPEPVEEIKEEEPAPPPEEPKKEEIIIKPLPPPRFITKNMPKIVDEQYLITHQALLCAWTRSSLARTYTVVLKNEKTGKVLKEYTTSSTSYRFTNLASLDNEQTLSWTVWANTRRKEYEPKSEEITYRFIVRLKSLQKPETEKVTYYDEN